RAHPLPHPFPTRRSSDLRCRLVLSRRQVINTSSPQAARALLHFGYDAFDFKANLGGSSTIDTIASITAITARLAAQHLTVVFQPDRKSTRLNSSHVKISY